MRGALSCRRPSTPPYVNRSCQRQTQVLSLLFWRMIKLVPIPSALSRRMPARQGVLLRGVAVSGDGLEPATISGVVVMLISVRVRQTRP